MTRFFGDAVFEDVEVSDNDLPRLNAVRDHEAEEIRFTEREVEESVYAVEQQGDRLIGEIQFATPVECKGIDADVEEMIREEIVTTESAITVVVHREAAEIVDLEKKVEAWIDAAEREGNRRIREIRDQTQREIQDIDADVEEMIREEIVTTESAIAVTEDPDEVERIRRGHECSVNVIREWGEAEKQWIRDDAEARINDIEVEVRNEIYRIKSWGERRIDQIRAGARADIDSIFTSRQIEPVYEVQGESTACDYCRAKIGEIGTMEMLEAKDCVPPFHSSCKCWLAEIGYCVL